MKPTSVNVLEPLLKIVNLSLTNNSSVLINEAVPLTIKSPCTITLSLNVVLTPTVIAEPLSKMLLLANAVPVHLDI